VNETEKAEALLESAGLRIEDAEERAAIVGAYAPLRASIEKLYADADGRYEDHGLRFEAEPPLADWRA
jgi:hypothetical protein